MSNTEKALQVYEWMNKSINQSKVKDFRFNDKINHNSNAVDNKHLLSSYSVPSIVLVAFTQITKFPGESWVIGS